MMALKGSRHSRSRSGSGSGSEGNLRVALSWRYK